MVFPVPVISQTKRACEDLIQLSEVVLYENKAERDSDMLQYLIEFLSGYLLIVSDLFQGGTLFY